MASLNGNYAVRSWQMYVHCTYIHTYIYIEQCPLSKLQVRRVLENYLPLMVPTMIMRVMWAGMWAGNQELTRTTTTTTRKQHNKVCVQCLVLRQKSSACVECRFDNNNKKLSRSKAFWSKFDITLIRRHESKCYSKW